jgi:hypothetical protein
MFGVTPSCVDLYCPLQYQPWLFGEELGWLMDRFSQELQRLDCITMLTVF